MAKSQKTTTDQTGRATNMAAGMFWANPAFASVWSKLMAENARFLSERLQEDLEAQKALLACKTPAEVIEVQSKFFQKAMSDYSDKAQRMFDLLTSTSGSPLNGLQASTKRGYDDVPL